MAHLRNGLRVAAIRRCALNGQGEQLFREGREREYVVLPGAPHLTETCGRLATLGRVSADYVGMRVETRGWLVTPDVVERYAPDLDAAGALVSELLRLARDEGWLVARRGGDLTLG